MTIYNVTITADPSMNGRSSPSSSSTANIIFPQGFKKGDVCKANQTSVVNGITWYAIYECFRAGVKITLPAPVVWGASASSTGVVYIRLDSTITDPPPPTDVFPTEIWVSMTATGERRRYVLVV